jgi:hypothetical protein
MPAMRDRAQQSIEDQADADPAAGWHALFDTIAAPVGRTAAQQGARVISASRAETRYIRPDSFSAVAGVEAPALT